jgi:hypothetical protein
MGRPPIGTQPMTPAERQRRHRATHRRKRGPDPTGALRQARWRNRRADEVTAEVRVAQAAQEAAAVDPIFIQAVAMLEERGEPELVPKLMASWPYMSPPVRQAMALGQGFRFWLKD